MAVLKQRGMGGGREKRKDGRLEEGREEKKREGKREERDGERRERGLEG